MVRGTAANRLPWPPRQPTEGKPEGRVSWRRHLLEFEVLPHLLEREAGGRIELHLQAGRGKFEDCRALDFGRELRLSSGLHVKLSFFNERFDLQRKLLR